MRSNITVLRRSSTDFTTQIDKYTVEDWKIIEHCLYLYRVIDRNRMPSKKTKIVPLFNVAVITVEDEF